MASRLELQRTLEETFPSYKVYFQPSESFKMKYPCIRYEFDGVADLMADNQHYRSRRRYTVTVMQSDPDFYAYERMYKAFTLCRMNQRYVSDNLYHETFTLYY